LEGDGNKSKWASVRRFRVHYEEASNMALSPCSSLSLSYPIENNVILFQILDSPPVLRRITVNGGMNDHISRQATLTLKHNGVYAVESTEDKGKVAWKFEYFVEDRQIPETGRIMVGEKVRNSEGITS
jgi:hypothetical protein